MAYTESSRKNIKNVDSFGLSHSQSSTNNAVQLEFYELELGVVLDIILDDTHPFFKKGSPTFNVIDAERWPEAIDGKPASSTDIDYSWIGRALVRPVVSGKNINKNNLTWAYPIDSNFSEYPLINETVVLSNYNGKTYYSKKVNHHNWANNNLDFSIDLPNGKNLELFSQSEFTGKQESSTNYKKSIGFKGFAGKYFKSNNRIRNLKRFEGDLAIESRFGQSIHMSAYDENRNNDTGSSTNADYRDSGNPMILIRNKQRPLLQEGKQLSLHNSPNPATIAGTPQEKNVGGYILENINHDGSSIHITSGQTISKFSTTCFKKMYGNGEEVSAFNGSTDFKFPILNGDQIVINSDRLILSSRYGESFHFAKKRYSVVTDSEYTVDAQDKIVMTTNNKLAINSPAIYLGEIDQTAEPALLGQTTINWMYNLCNWMLEHTHWINDNKTQMPVQIAQLIDLRDSLKDLLSKRVFLTGGGFASGQNGASINGGKPPVSINTSTGAGVPGGFQGTNFRN